MPLDRDLVRRIAELARLDLSLTEEEVFTRQLSEIVAYVDQLREFETATPAGPPADQPTAPEADDTPAASLPRPSFLANAPQSRDGYLVVPRVMAAAHPQVPLIPPRSPLMTRGDAPHPQGGRPRPSQGTAA